MASSNYFVYRFLFFMELTSLPHLFWHQRNIALLWLRVQYCPYLRTWNALSREPFWNLWLFWVISEIFRPGPKSPLSHPNCFPIVASYWDPVCVFLNLRNVFWFSQNNPSTPPSPAMVKVILVPIYVSKITIKAFLKVLHHT